MATLLDGDGAGRKLYVDADGRVGGLGGPPLLDDNVEREARGLMAQGRSTMRSFGEDGATLGSGLRVHVSAFAEPPRMLIFGAIDFSAALAQLAQRARLPRDDRRSARARSWPRRASAPPPTPSPPGRTRCSSG